MALLPTRRGGLVTLLHEGHDDAIPDFQILASDDQIGDRFGADVAPAVPSQILHRDHLLFMVSVNGDPQ